MKRKIYYCTKTALFIVFISFFLMLCGNALAQPLLNLSSCIRSPFYSEFQILIFLDRTTELDANAQDRYNEGIESIFSKQSIAGRLSILEIRDKESEVPNLGNGCIASGLPNPYSLKLEQGASKSTISSLFSGVGQLWSGLFDDQETNTDSDKIDDISARRAAVNFLEGIIKENNPTAEFTEIPDTLVSGIQGYCNGKAVCKIFIYTDLLDSNAKADYEQGKDMTEAGTIDAQNALQEFQPDISKTLLEMTVWGFGRDDSAPGVELTQAKKKAFTKYWDAFFRVLRDDGAPGSSYEISSVLD